MIDLYNNYQFRNVCIDYVELCAYVKNPCCINFNKSDPNPCGTFDCFVWNDNYFAWEKPGLLRFFVFLPIQFILGFSIVLLYEAGTLRKFFYTLKNLFGTSDVGITSEQEETERLYGDLKKDSDVIDEEKRIEELVKRKEQHNEMFVVNHLTKYYSKFMAVKGISFSVDSSECFGLLG